jgi:hypothetical protein
VILKSKTAISLSISETSHCTTSRLFYRRVNEVIHEKGRSELAESYGKKL